MIHFDKMAARFSTTIFFVILMIGLSACVDTDVESGKYELKINDFVNQAIDEFEDQQKKKCYRLPTWRTQKDLTRKRNSKCSYLDYYSFS